MLGDDGWPRRATPTRAPARFILRIVAEGTERVFSEGACWARTGGHGGPPECPYSRELTSIDTSRANRMAGKS